MQTHPLAGPARWAGVERAIPASKCWRAAGNAPRQHHVYPRVYWATTRERGVVDPACYCGAFDLLQTTIN